jgi:biopolymer transport protein ExbD
MKTLAEGSRPITDINVTPLVDIILVVLIIFMATAPLMERKALRVDVPKAKHSERAGLEALEVVYDKARALSIGGRALTPESLVAQLKERLRADPEMRVILSADRALPYGDIVGVLDLIRGAGLKKVSLEVKGGA